MFKRGFRRAVNSTRNLLIINFRGFTADNDANNDADFGTEQCVRNWSSPLIQDKVMFKNIITNWIYTYLYTISIHSMASTLSRLHQYIQSHLH